MERDAVGSPATAVPDAGDGQVRIVVADDLRRSRLTVFFRALLALPHLVFLFLWTLVMVLVAVANWFVVLIRGRTMASGLISRYLRYFTHVHAYLHLGANPFPGFAGEQGSYPIDLEVPEVRAQSRWSAAFRIVLALPALFLASSVAGSYMWLSFGVVAVGAFLAWFVALALGRMAQGLRDLIAYGVGYLAQVSAYMLLLTDGYPRSDPRRPRYGDSAPDHPVRIVVADDLGRSRLTVLLRLLIAIPHLIWLLLWAIAASFVVVVNWFVTLFAGRPAGALHRFLSAYLRYATHVSAFLYLIANPFPGFAGTEGSYPVDIRLPAPERQNRWKTGFRLILALPAALIAGTLGNALMLVAVFGWFTGVILGRMPEGLRNLGAFALRYTVQSWAYMALLTDRYPFAGPSLELLPAPQRAPDTTPPPA